MVDTSQLIKNRYDIFRSSRVACFLDHEQEMNIIQASKFRQKSLLSKIFYEKTFLSPGMVTERQLLKGDRCIGKHDVSLINLIKSEHVFFVGSQFLMDFVLALLSMFEKGLSIWVSEESVEEYNLVTYYSDRHSYNRQRYTTM